MYVLTNYIANFNFTLKPKYVTKMQQKFYNKFKNKSMCMQNF